MAGIDQVAFDTCIAERAEAAFAFLERLVAVPSVVGNEQEAQELVAAQLERGFRRRVELAGKRG